MSDSLLPMVLLHVPHSIALSTPMVSVRDAGSSSIQSSPLFELTKTSYHELKDMGLGTPHASYPRCSLPIRYLYPLNAYTLATCTGKAYFDPVFLAFTSLSDLPSRLILGPHKLPCLLSPTYIGIQDLSSSKFSRVAWKAVSHS